MTRFGLSLTSPTGLVLAALALASVACGATGSDDDSGAGATGGGSGTGGTGATATGGTGATGGGSGGSGGGTSAYVFTEKYTFDTDEQKWQVEYTSSGKEDDGTTAVPLVAASDVKVNWVSNKGDGDAMGAIECDIPFTTHRQYAGIGISYKAGADMTGRVVTARVKLDSGLESPSDLATYTAGAKIYLKSGAEYVYAAGPYLTISAAGGWATLTFDVGNPSSWSFVDTSKGMFDPTTIGELGIQFDTPDAAAAKNITSAVELIDNVTW
jgi:hypothetical protein